MISEQEAKSIIDYGRSQGFTQEQVFALLNRRDYELKQTQAQVDWDKKHAEEAAKIEAERKKAKEDAATETALKKPFTFQTGVEPEEEEEVQPGIGVLAPEVELTNAEKNAKFKADNEIEFAKRQETSLEDFYKNVLVPRERKTNALLQKMGPEELGGWEGGDLVSQLPGAIQWAKFGVKGIAKTGKRAWDWATGEEKPYEGSLLQRTRIDEGLDTSKIDLPDAQDDLPDTRGFWRHVGIDIDAEYKKWKDAPSTELPDNIFETPSFEDYEAVQIPSAGGTTTEYRVKDGVEASPTKQIISAEEYNTLKTEAEKQDPDLAFNKKRQKEKETKDFKFYEAK